MKRSIGLAAVMALVLSAPAQGANIQYAGGFTSTTPLAQFSATADCASGRSALGGGAGSTAGFGGSSLNSTFPNDGPDPDSRRDDSWDTYVDSYSTAAASSIVACVGGRAASKLRYRFREATLGPSATRRSVTAKCPKGSKVTGGGGFASGGFGTVEGTATRPSKRNRAWRVTFLRIAAGEYQVIAYAVCAKGRFAKRLRYRKRANDVASGTQGFVGIDCPGSSKATGAGVATDALAPRINSVHPTTTGAGTQAFVDATGGSLRATAYAICHG